MEDEQEIKQSFLRKEILEKNYDANVFLEFLITKKGEIASDINNWTIEELHTVVSEFKNSQNENQKENISTNPILEDLPPAENGILKINSIMPTPFGNRNKEIKINENDYNNELYNEDGSREWLFENKAQNERFSRYSISNFNIIELLYLSLGYIGIYELTQLMKGVSHTAEEGRKFAVKVMKELRDTTEQWKKETGAVKDSL